MASIGINISRQDLTDYLSNININSIDQNIAIGKRKFIEQRLKYIHRLQSVIYNENDIKEELQNNGVLFYNKCNFKENFNLQAERLLGAIVASKKIE